MKDPTYTKEDRVFRVEVCGTHISGKRIAESVLGSKPYEAEWRIYITPENGGEPLFANGDDRFIHRLTEADKYEYFRKGTK